jgi:hypothetical protein
MGQFLHIGIKFAGATKVSELIPVFDKALDWVRYAPNCWMVWTTSSHEVWYARLKPHLSDSDHLFIATLDLRQGYYGWLPQVIWDWLSKDRKDR